MSDEPENTPIEHADTSAPDAAPSSGSSPAHDEAAHAAEPSSLGSGEHRADDEGEFEVPEQPEHENDVTEATVSGETVVQHHFTAPVNIALDKLDDDLTFLIRSPQSLEDVSALATDLARLGQLFPIDVRLVAPDRMQVVTGFRRVAALRFLQRERVVVRLHEDLSDNDATLMSLAAAIHSQHIDAETLVAAKERIQAEGRLSAAARDMFEKALATESSLSPENVEEEVDADELAGDVTMRLGEINQDLSLLADIFEELDDQRRQALLTQLKYSADLVTFLESKK